MRFLTLRDRVNQNNPENLEHDNLSLVANLRESLISRFDGLSAPTGDYFLRNGCGSSIANSGIAMH